MHALLKGQPHKAKHAVVVQLFFILAQPSCQLASKCTVGELYCFVIDMFT